MDLSFVKTRLMIRKAVVGSIMPILLSPIILLPDMPAFVRVFFGLLLFNKFLALVSIGFFGMNFNGNDVITFTRCFKRFDFYIKQIAEIHLSELNIWVKLSYSGKIMLPAFTYPFITFLIKNSDGKHLKLKVFVSTFNEDGVALQAFFARLKELNPSLIVPDVQAFNATLK
jgi:hypothetical protein